MGLHVCAELWVRTQILKRSTAGAAYLGEVRIDNVVEDILLLARVGSPLLLAPVAALLVGTLIAALEGHPVAFGVCTNTVGCSHFAARGGWG